jgi:hypothetical protein
MFSLTQSSFVRGTAQVSSSSGASFLAASRHFFFFRILSGCGVRVVGSFQVPPLYLRFSFFRERWSLSFFGGDECTRKRSNAAYKVSARAFRAFTARFRVREASFSARSFAFFFVLEDCVKT